MNRQEAMERLIGAVKAENDWKRHPIIGRNDGTSWCESLDRAILKAAHEVVASDDSLTPAAVPASARKDRIWVLHCPFRKDGAPVLGSFGARVNPVVILPLATWKKLCAEIPALGTHQFEVGANEVS